MDIEPLRARRRRITATVAQRRLSSFIRILPDKDPSRSRRASSPSFWASVTPWCCGCTKRHRGAPKRDKGMCCAGARRRIYQWRAEARALKQGHYEEQED